MHARRRATTPTCTHLVEAAMLGWVVVRGVVERVGARSGQRRHGCWVQLLTTSGPPARPGSFAALPALLLLCGEEKVQEGAVPGVGRPQQAHSPRPRVGVARCATVSSGRRRLRAAAYVPAACCVSRLAEAQMEGCAAQTRACSSRLEKGRRRSAATAKQQRGVRSTQREGLSASRENSTGCWWML